MSASPWTYKCFEKSCSTHLCIHHNTHYGDVQQITSMAIPFETFLNRVSTLHMNLQVVNFQRCKCASGSSKEPEPVPSMSGVSEIAACPLSPIVMILQLYHLPPPLPLPVSNSSCLFTRCQPPYASCCTVLLYFSRYCTVRLTMFSLFFVFVFYVLFVWKVL